LESNLSSAISSIQAADADYQNQIAVLQAQIAAFNAVTNFKSLELTPALVAGGSVANSAGNTGVAADAQGVPTSLNAYRQIFPNGPYQDKYWYWELGADATKTKYVYEIRFMLPSTADCQASQALELDVEQRISDEIFNVGFQADFTDQKTFNIWNRSATTPTVPHGWISTGIPCPRWTPGQWHSVKLEAHRDGHFVHYDALTLDGTRTDLSSFSYPTITANKSDCLNCAIQLDANSAGAAYIAYIDAVNVTVS